jgi:hypothetical protein
VSLGVGIFIIVDSIYKIKNDGKEIDGDNGSKNKKKQKIMLFFCNFCLYINSIDPPPLDIKVMSRDWLARYQPNIEIQSDIPKTMDEKFGQNSEANRRTEREFRCLTQHFQYHVKSAVRRSQKQASFTMLQQRRPKGGWQRRI